MLSQQSSFIALSKHDLRWLRLRSGASWRTLHTRAARALCSRAEDSAQAPICWRSPSCTNPEPRCSFAVRKGKTIQLKHSPNTPLHWLPSPRPPQCRQMACMECLGNRLPHTNDPTIYGVAASIRQSSENFNIGEDHLYLRIL